MDLQLHIGTEKTGSSYLQSLAAVNRKMLQEQGIWFPRAGKREKQLQDGEISAGNAQPLTDALEQNNWPEVTKLLSTWLREAIKHDCKQLLLSNELLVLALIRPDKLKRFFQIIAAAGFKQIYALLILRDPVDQALSLYKHRAKSGSAPSVENWPENHYHYGQNLPLFFKATEGSPLQLTVRKYRTHQLEQLFFHDWMGVKGILKQPKQVVNPSLSLSELMLIRQLRRYNKLLPRFLYEQFLSLPRNQKAPEPKLTHYYKTILAQHLSQYKETWELCNQFLPNGEKLEIPNSNTQAINKDEEILTFSSAQGKVIANFMKETVSPTFQWEMRYRKCRNRLGKLKNRVLKVKR